MKVELHTRDNSINNLLEQRKEQELTLSNFHIQPEALSSKTQTKLIQELQEKQNDISK